MNKIELKHIKKEGRTESFEFKINDKNVTIQSYDIAESSTKPGPVTLTITLLADPNTSTIEIRPVDDTVCD